MLSLSGSSRRSSALPSYSNENDHSSRREASSSRRSGATALSSYPDENYHGSRREAISSHGSCQGASASARPIPR